MTAVEIAAAVRSGQRSAVDVVEEHLARIEEREAELHAFNLVLVDEARAAADAVDAAVAAGRDPGPLAGVPVALKDNMVTRGIATNESSRPKSVSFLIVASCWTNTISVDCARCFIILRMKRIRCRFMIVSTR